MLLEQRGYRVTSGLGLTEALEHCKNGDFDLFILGHSIHEKDKVHLIKTFRSTCPGPILSLQRVGEKQVPCDFEISADDPEEFIQLVDDILSGRAERVNRSSNNSAG
jgi:DNA-binding response OmpR family regulator